ncbi:MAG TPA: ethanolamine ammonia-lyase reactivating factor EutA, partial [Stellaceae bacterium]|nr:ethanolamine ammonia-lyase reactivating factor EutA [Stellaceae bacterium]
MHDTEFLHEHGEPPTEEQRAALAAFIWSQEHVELKTVGIDIGSSTSHLLFAKVVLQRQSQGLSSRFTVVDRQVLWRSPIMLTPFLPDGTIDAQSLARFIDRAYQDAGFARGDIDSGAVILTGEAIKRRNARAIDELFADEAGKFVCATAGHILECRLAAHGSGAVRLSREREQCVLHVDIGGGTTKLALIDRGKVLSAAAFAVGGRLIATDAEGKWTRVDDSARLVAAELGLGTAPHQLADPETRDALARRLAAVAADYVLGAELDALGKKLMLTEPLRRAAVPTALTFSGGVSEYIFGTEAEQYGDIALPLARALTRALSERSGLPLVDPGQRIRATVIGASQFTIQVSGKTIYLSDASILPVHGIPVVHVGRTAEDSPDTLAEAIRRGLIGLDLDPDSRVAIAFSWQGDPEYHRLAAAGRAIVAATAPKGARSEPL